MDKGHRLIVSCVDYYAAHEPERVWAKKPRNDEDLKAGFDDISFAELSNAVNHVSFWLRDALAQARSNVFAYQGPNDLRVPLLCLAAAKVGKEILLPSMVLPKNALKHLIRESGCATYIHPSSLASPFSDSELNIQDVQAPELKDWLWAPPIENYPFEKSWEQAKDDPWIIFHTSGTTGLPKIIRCTHQMMTVLEAADLLPPHEGPTGNYLFRQGSWFTPVPLFHLVGLVLSFQAAILLGGVHIVAPPGPPSPIVLKQMIDYAHPYGIAPPPGLLEALAAEPEGWATLMKVKCINFVGAPLRKSLGDSFINAGITVVSGLGSTEVGPYLQRRRGDSEWEWLSFMDSMGASFEHYPGEEEVYEMVVKRKPGCERFQQIFHLYPDAEEYRTKDLFYKHPTLPDAWKYAGRADDYVKLSSGFGVNAAHVENMIMERLHDSVEWVVVGGVSRAKPCLLVAPKVAALRTKGSHEAFMEQIWPAIQDCNESFSELARIPRRLVMLLDVENPAKMTGKGTVSRSEILSSNAGNIETLYDQA